MISVLKIHTFIESEEKIVFGVCNQYHKLLDKYNIDFKFNYSFLSENSVFWEHVFQDPCKTLCIYFFKPLAFALFSYEFGSALKNSSDGSILIFNSISSGIQITVPSVGSPGRLIY